jgi:carboxyl-terminal processing protease
VQSLLELGQQLFGNASTVNLGALKITMQQFYRPNGDSTQRRGVLSDVILPSLSDHIEGISESDLDYAMQFDKVPSNSFPKYNQVSPEIITQLRARSLERVQRSEDFAKMQRTIERYLEQKAKKEVTLNETKFLAQRKEIDAEREEEKKFEEAAEGNKNGEVVKRDYYFNEVLAVTVDYLQLLGQNAMARVN